jgi:hypothetical protein
VKKLSSDLEFSPRRAACVPGASPQPYPLPVCLHGLRFAWISNISFNRMIKEKLKICYGIKACAWRLMRYIITKINKNCPS